FERRRCRLIPDLMKQADDRCLNPLRSAAVSFNTDFLEQLVDVKCKLVGAQLSEVAHGDSPPLLLAENYRLSGVFYKGISVESVQLLAHHFLKDFHPFTDQNLRSSRRDVAPPQTLTPASPRAPVEAKIARHEKIQLKKCGDSFAADHF